MKQIQPRQNYLGPGGWVWGGHYGIERYLYLLHRITGLGLILWVIIHLIFTTFLRIQGQDVWEALLSFGNNPWFVTAEYLAVAAFIYHALNGLRLTIQELGFGLGKPIPPIYPYTDALRRKRPWTIAMVAVIIILAVLVLIGFVAGGY